MIMKKVIVLLILILFLTGCGKGPKPIGEEKNKHGCLGAEGYRWCPSKNECVRVWETYCEEYAENFQGEVTNFDQCVSVTNIIMESYPRQCKFNDQTFVEDVEDIIID